VINKPLAELISEMAALLELKQDNPFRIRAYQNAAMAIQSFPEDLGKMSREDILKIAGIGQGIADKIQEFAKTGKVRSTNSCGSSSRKDCSTSCRSRDWVLSAPASCSTG
jgi:DNA polymerase/3'-5' exonuclease PolX